MVPGTSEGAKEQTRIWEPPSPENTPVSTCDICRSYPPSLQKPCGSHSLAHMVRKKQNKQQKKHQPPLDHCSHPVSRAAAAPLFQGTVVGVGRGLRSPGSCESPVGGCPQGSRAAEEHAAGNRGLLSWNRTRPPRCRRRSVPTGAGPLRPLQPRALSRAAAQERTDSHEAVAALVQKVRAGET